MTRRSPPSSSRPALKHVDPQKAANASGYYALPSRWELLSVTQPGIIELAAELLCTRTQVLPLTIEFAHMVVGYFRPFQAREGHVLVQEGEASDAHDLMLILRGEVQVHTVTQADLQGATIELARLGPGDILGEMALLDGLPRAATCTVTRDLVGATLSRSAMEVMAHDIPHVAARLMAAICERLVLRLRENNQVLCAHMDSARELQELLLQKSAQSAPAQPATRSAG